MEQEIKLKRYNLVLPTPLYEKLETVAERNNRTVADVLRQFIKLGLYATQVDEAPDAALLIRRGDTVEQIRLFL